MESTGQCHKEDVLAKFIKELSLQINIYKRKLLLFNLSIEDHLHTISIHKNKILMYGPYMRHLFPL